MEHSALGGPVPGSSQAPRRQGVMTKPDLADYLTLFGRYGRDFGEAYLEPADERYRLLFDQICRMLAQPSNFNLSLPQAFRTTAYRYLAGDEATLARMRDPDNRHFMLSDLYDYLDLRHRMGGTVGSL
jgi:hypothetical protein